MTPVTRLFAVEHLWQLQHPPSHVSDEMLRRVAQVYTTGDAVTFWERDRVLGSFGLVIKWPGSGIVWTWFDREFPRTYPIWLRRETLARLAASVDAHQLWRVEADAPCEAAVSQRWLKSLGFRSEGVMQRYGHDGRDHIRYAWVSGLGEIGKSERRAA